MVPEKIVFSQWIQYFSQPQPGMEHFLWIICFVQTPAAPRLLHWDTVPSHCGGHGSEWWFRWPLMNCLQSDIPLYCINYKANHAAWRSSDIFCPFLFFFIVFGGGYHHYYGCSFRLLLFGGCLPIAATQSSHFEHFYLQVETYWHKCIVAYSTVF